MWYMYTKENSNRNELVSIYTVNYILDYVYTMNLTKMEFNGDGAK
jgi:hypothetical protein